MAVEQGAPADCMSREVFGVSLVPAQPLEDPVTDLYGIGLSICNLKAFPVPVT